MNKHNLSTKQITISYETIIKKARDRVIESIADNMELYGINLSVGHLYGTLLFQNKPMTLDEMGEALGMSKTSMSTGVRNLLDLNMVNKVWVKGARKDHYDVEQDWHQNFIDYFSIKWRKAIDENVQVLRKSTRELNVLLNDEQIPNELKDEVELDINKMQNALDYYKWLSRLIDTFESHEIFQYVPK